MKQDFLADMGAALLEGLASSWSGPQAETFERGVTVLRKHVPFDGVWWGRIDGLPNASVTPNFHVAGSLGLSSELRNEYSQICGEDAFAAAVVENPGVVLRWSGPKEDISPDIQAWVERHHLAHGAAIFSEIGFKNQALVVAFYRFEGASKAFTDNEALAIRLFITQLEMLWSKGLSDAFNFLEADYLSDVLLAKADGRLIYCGAKMAKVLAAIGWDQKGDTVPNSLLQCASVGGRMRAGNEWLVVSFDEGGFRAQLESSGQVTSLPSRVMRVSVLSCKGKSAKEIGKELGLSPTTVKTYLREAYSLLSVHNKLELRNALKSVL